MEPFGKTPAWVRRAVAEEAERLAAYCDCTLKLVGTTGLY